MRKYIAEFIGTFALVLCGCGSMIHYQLYPSTEASVVISLAFTISVGGMIYLVGHISGAHFNPAVSFSFFSLGMLSLKDLLIYILAQVAGALAASTVHSFYFLQQHSFGKTILSVSIEKGATIELFMSGALMFVITLVATSGKFSKWFGAMAIGTTVGLCAYFGGAYTGASMNPARSLAPAIFSGDFSDAWVYFLITSFGAWLGMRLYSWLTRKARL